MMVSTKGRYALQVMIYLAENNTGAYIPLKKIADNQGISKKYLERIMSVLSKAEMVDALNGKGGGYRLNRKPCEYTAGSILKLAEGTLVPITCLEDKHSVCKRAENCRTLPLWTELQNIIDTYLESVTVEDLAKMPLGCCATRI